MDHINKMDNSALVRFLQSSLQPVGKSAQLQLFLSILPCIVRKDSEVDTDATMIQLQKQGIDEFKSQVIAEYMNRNYVQLKSALRKMDIQAMHDFVPDEVKVSTVTKIGSSDDDNACSNFTSAIFGLKQVDEDEIIFEANKDELKQLFNDLEAIQEQLDSLK